LIFTYMWAFDQQSDWDYIAHVHDIFTAGHPDTEFYYVELVASQEVRLQRNRTENRLLHKASKRNLENSEHILLADDQKYRLVSQPGEIPFENYLRIENSNLSPETAAQMIRQHFSL